ncbi:MAG: hypothetical protein ACKO37_09145 [Vampirovibrionales bacterium]
MSYHYHLRVSTQPSVQPAIDTSLPQPEGFELEFEGPHGETLQPMLTQCYQTLYHTLHPTRTHQLYPATASQPSNPPAMAPSDEIESPPSQERHPPVPQPHETHAVASSSAESAEVVEFQSLEDLLQEFKETSPMVLLLGCAFFMAWKQNIPSFQLRDINRLLIQSARPPVTSPLLEEALDARFIVALPSPTEGNTSGMLHQLTDTGRVFLEGFLR